MIKKLLINLSLAVGTLVVVILFCEFVVFRFIVPASDIPRNTFSNGVIKYLPHQTGVYRIRNEIAARYTINAQGWNSTIDDYELAKPPVIAVVGDSYVEALQVDSDKCFAERVALCSGRSVLRFGIAGSPLSQYLHMIREEVVRYSPQTVIVLVVHNDFVDSFKMRMGRYTSSFNRFDVDAGVVTEISPQPYEPKLAWLRGSAWYRFMVDRMRVRVDALKRRILKPQAEKFAGNVSVTSITNDREAIEAVTRHFFEQLSLLAKENDFEPIVIVDGDRQAIYRNAPSEALDLNALCMDVGGNFGVDVIDLHDVFVARYAVDHRRFDFEYDGHWNAYAHDIVANVLCAHLSSDIDGADGARR